MRNSELLVWYGMVLTLLAVLVDVFVPVSTTEAQSSTGERPMSVLLLYFLRIVQYYLSMVPLCSTYLASLCNM